MVAEMKESQPMLKSALLREIVGGAQMETVLRPAMARLETITRPPCEESVPDKVPTQMDTQATIAHELTITIDHGTMFHPRFMRSDMPDTT